MALSVAVLATSLAVVMGWVGGPFDAAAVAVREFMAALRSSSLAHAVLAPDGALSPREWAPLQLVLLISVVAACLEASKMLLTTAWRQAVRLLQHVSYSTRTTPVELPSEATLRAEANKMDWWPYNQWYAVIESSKLPASEPINLRRFGQEFALWRDGDGRPVAHADRCPHRGASLSAGGRLVSSPATGERCLVCPYHMFHFDRTGKCVLQPTESPDPVTHRTHDLVLVPVREQFDYIWLWYGDTVDLLPELPSVGHEELPAVDGGGKPHSLVRGNSRNSYSEGRAYPHTYHRLVENTMLDHAHFGVLHGNWLYRLTTGIRSRLLRGYECQFIEPGKKGLYIRGRFEAKDGDKNSVFIQTHVYFPGFLVIQYDPQWYFFVAISPIDADHSYMILRHAQNHCSLPFIGRWLARLLVWMERDVFFHEDNVVLSKQKPRHFGWRTDRYVKSDRPIQMFKDWLRQNRPPSATDW